MAAIEHPVPMRGRPQPARSNLAGLPQLHLIEHPLLDHLTSLLRDARTPGPDFTRAVEEITRFLLWQALAATPSDIHEVPGHTGEPVRATALRPEIATLAILRAGLSMVPPIRHLIPFAPVYQIGIKRDESTLLPHVYYHTNLPATWERMRHLLLLDPMLATGGSALAAIDLVRRGFSGQISYLGIIGAPIGVERVIAADPSIRIFLAALDDRLNDRGFIVPGLGDAGDRVFGTV
jgi:uracil phosphoribosyltransferase